MGRNAKANLVTLIVLTGFALSVAFHYVKGVYLMMPYPHTTCLYSPGNRFADFYVLLDWNKGLNPYLQGIPTAQYPLLNLLSYALSKIDRNWSFEIYHAIVIVALLLLTGVALRSLDRSQVYLRALVLTLLTYPALFTIDRGNFESLVCVSLLLFAWGYQRGHSRLAAFFLACAIALKLFPVVLLMLFVSDRKYKEAIQVVLWAAALTLGALATFEGGFSQNLEVLLTGKNLTANANVAMFTDHSPLVQRGVSLFSSLKILHFQYGLIRIDDAGGFLRKYAIAAALLSLLIFLYVVLVETRTWKKVMLLAFVMLVFPQISADYKLMHVLVPLLLFIGANTKSRLDAFYAIGFSLLLIPKNYMLLDRVYTEAKTMDVTIAMLLNPLIMIIMMVVAVVTGLSKASWKGIRSVVGEHRRALTKLVWPFAQKASRRIAV